MSKPWANEKWRRAKVTHDGRAGGMQFLRCLYGNFFYRQYCIADAPRGLWAYSEPGRTLVNSFVVIRSSRFARKQPIATYWKNLSTAGLHIFHMMPGIEHEDGNRPIVDQFVLAFRDGSVESGSALS